MTGVYVIVMVALSAVLLIEQLSHDWSAAIWILVELAAIGVAIAVLGGERCQAEHQKRRSRR